MKLRPILLTGITARLVAIALLPALMMFAAIAVTLYLTTRGEAEAEIKDRGELTALALAESSQYSVVSGNVAALSGALRGMLDTDPSIARIEVLNADRVPFASATNTSVRGGTASFEATVRADVPEVDLFDSAGSPHVSLVKPEAPRFRAGRAVGYVRVTMQTEPLLAEKRARLGIAILLVALATVVSGLAGLALAHGLRTPLRNVMTALRRIRSGNYAVALDTHASGEMGELQRTILSMAASLEETRHGLEELVDRRTTALQQAVDAAKQSDTERRRLIARGNASIEEERRRLAIEIHDQLNATLVFAQMQTARIRSLAEHIGVGDAHAIKGEIDAIADELARTTGELYTAARNIVRSLRPEVIDTLGLTKALEELVRQYDRAHEACAFTLVAPGDFPTLRGAAAMTAYRVVQEALSNVVKHSNATSATVKIARADRANAMQVSVIDDGVGFDAQRASDSGIGLIGMRERIHNAGGEIKIESSDSGTMVTFELPID